MVIICVNMAHILTLNVMFCMLKAFICIILNEMMRRVDNRLSIVYGFVRS